MGLGGYGSSDEELSGSAEQQAARLLELEDGATGEAGTARLKAGIQGHANIITDPCQCGPTISLLESACKSSLFSNGLQAV